MQVDSHFCVARGEKSTSAQVATRIAIWTAPQQAQRGTSGSRGSPAVYLRVAGQGVQPAADTRCTAYSQLPLFSYNVLVQQMYAYDANDNIRRKRSLLEGTTLHQPLNRSLADVPKRNSNATVDNPYFENNPATTGSGFTDDSFNFVKIRLPLTVTGSGIFRNPKIFPLMLTQGLRIEILRERHRQEPRSAHRGSRLLHLL
jgi:hypothetical protein